MANRPLGERERHGLFALTAGLVVCTAALLLGLSAAPGPELRLPDERTLLAQTRGVGAPEGRATDLRSGETAARRFLAGYLQLLYGRGHVRAIEAASGRLRRRLAGKRLRVLPAARRRHPRIINIQVEPIRAGRVVARAVIGDGGSVRYPIELGLSSGRGGWEVDEVADH